jgi:hypothetical protein
LAARAWRWRLTADMGHHQHQGRTIYYNRPLILDLLQSCPPATSSPDFFF